VVVRFRHPEKARLRGVLVNGQPADSFDADREWIVLPSIAEVTTVEGLF
jgi:hypothetical protein